jgi:hypothetical protein
MYIITLKHKKSDITPLKITEGDVALGDDALKV